MVIQAISSQDKKHIDIMDPFGRLRSLLSLAHIFLLETVSLQSLSLKWFQRYGRSCRTNLVSIGSLGLGHVPEIFRGNSSGLIQDGAHSRGAVSTSLPK